MSARGPLVLSYKEHEVNWEDYSFEWGLSMQGPELSNGSPPLECESNPSVLPPELMAGR